MLKKIFKQMLGLLLCGMSITVAYAAAELTLTEKIFQPILKQYCQSELSTAKFWQVSTLLLSQKQQQQAEEKVCSCVAEHGVRDVSTKEVLLAWSDEAAKHKLMQKIAVESLKGCTQKAFLSR